MEKAEIIELKNCVNYNITICYRNISVCVHFELGELKVVLKAPLEIVGSECTFSDTYYINSKYIY